MNPANIARATLVAAVLMLAAGPLHRFGVIGWQASWGCSLPPRCWPASAPAGACINCCAGVAAPSQ